MIEFGPWSTTLAAGMAFGLLVALLLSTTRQNASANRLLAAAIGVLALKLAPYVIGFAGFYEPYPWLSFAPLSFGLALGPLLYLHVVRLTSAALPPGWRWHLLPAALQLGYYLVMFVQPLAVKNAWATNFDAPWIDPIETVGELMSWVIYLILALRCYQTYQRRLDATLSNREQFRIGWLRNLLLVMLVMWALTSGFELASAWLSFDYFQRFPLYLVITALITYLGLEGWRQSDVAYPSLTTLEMIGTPDKFPERDWKQLGEQWRTRLSHEEWWRDPELSLDRLASHLGTNTSYLSRALNEGLGSTFNALVNGMRVEAVKANLLNSAVQSDLVTMSQAVGFNSKTTFNRVFRAHTGQTPSQFRSTATGSRIKT